MAPRRRLPFLALLVAALAAAVLAHASPAGAAHDVRYGIKDDAWLMDGPGTLSQRLQTLDRIGVQVVRLTLRWDEIATQRPRQPENPNDPAYRWGAFDAVVRGLQRHGIEPLLDIWGTPWWANRGRGAQWAPNRGATIAQFAVAAACRYPFVRRWLAWNEPNQARWLRPTLPSVYVERILNPIYTALHRLDAHVQVGGGVTAPRGDRGGVSPVAWIAGMRTAHARLDAYAHNPYPLNPHTESPISGGCGHCHTYTMATLPALVRAVGRAFGNHTRIWLTEYGYQTWPPDPFLGVPAATQARYQSEAAMRAYEAPRVDLLIHFLYRDEPSVGGWQSGLVWLDGRAKPALAAFELPLAEESRRGARVTLWGQVRTPEVASYRFEVRRGGRWRPLAPGGRVRDGGFVSWTGKLGRGAQVRLVAGRIAGPPLTVT